MMRAMWRLQAVLVLALVGGIGSCDGGKGLALRVEVHPDMSGTLTVMRLAAPADPLAVEGASPNVTWTSRARLECSSGTFAAIDGLTVGDVRFAYIAANGIARLTVSLPRGPGARWPALLTLPDKTTRDAATRLVDPDQLLGDPGGSIALRLQLPAEVRTDGVRPVTDSLVSKIDGKRADLLVPVKLAATEGEPIVWTLTWDT